MRAVSLEEIRLIALKIKNGSVSMYETEPFCSQVGVVDPSMD